MSDHLEDRGKMMESLFYKQLDQELLQRIRDERADQATRDQLIAASGMSDSEAIDALVNVGVTADSLTAVALIPLVSVAWADREMHDNEKQTILEAAEATGISKDGASYALLAGWLQARPGTELLDAWKAYIVAIKETTDPATANNLKSSVLSTAKAVAEAAGGIFGLGNKTSAAEQQVLDDLESAF